MRDPSPPTPRFQPPDASVAPRYTGPRTFARLPHVSYRTRTSTPP